MAPLAGKKIVEALRVKADHHLLPDHQCWSGAALVSFNQFADGVGVAADVAFFKFDTSRREVGLHRAARRSAGLREYQDGTFHSRVENVFKDYQNSTFPCQMYSMTVVILAVFCSMADTEQYFSLDNRTASSMPFLETWPPTR